MGAESTEGSGTPSGDGAGTEGDQSQGQGAGSLLEDDADELDGSEQGGEQGDGQGEGLDVGQLVDQLEQRLGARFDAIADRRVNALLKEIRGSGQSQGGQQGDGTPPPPPAAPTTTAGDVRATRLIAREYLTDQVRFISTEERALAMDMVAEAVQAKAAVGIDDEETVGREVAKAVAERIKTMRSHYEQRTVNALKKRGALVEKPGQPTPGGNQVTSGSQFEKGRQIAERFRPPTTSQ